MFNEPKYIKLIFSSARYINILTKVFLVREYMTKYYDD